MSKERINHALWLKQSHRASRRESYNNQDRNVGQAADREEKGWTCTRKMKRGVGTQWENEKKRR